MTRFKIGDISFANRLFLAPMVEVTDAAYRKVCRDSGAAMSYIEMINIGAILHENVKTRNLMKTYPGETPSGIQITGRSVDEFIKVVPFLKNYSIVDVNCGCPSIRITDNASGSYLLRNPSKIGKMIDVLKNAGFNTTAKIRLGFKKNNVVAIAKAIERAGADALTLHARMAYHGNSVPADWKWISKVKKNIGIPVIGNGDVDSGQKAAAMLDIADGCMIARAAIGNPLIFKHILYYLKTGKERQIETKENLFMFAKYLDLVEKYGFVDIARIKYVGGSFLRNFSGAAKARSELMQLKDLPHIRSFSERLAQL